MAISPNKVFNHRYASASLDSQSGVSLLTSANNAIDITMHLSNRDSVFDEAKRLFKDARVVEIDIEG